MEVKPASRPSMRYMSEPMMSAMVRTEKRKMSILRRESLSARAMRLESEMKWASLRMRKMRRSRRARTTMRDWAPVRMSEM